jgi:hypothetical protein
MFTARYALSLYIKQICFVFKGLIWREVTNNMSSNYCIFLCWIPPWRWPTKAETCRKIKTYLCIIVVNYSAVVGILVYCNLSYCMELSYLKHCGLFGAILLTQRKMYSYLPSLMLVKKLVAERSLTLRVGWELTGSVRWYCTYQWWCKLRVYLGNKVGKVGSVRMQK